MVKRLVWLAIGFVLGALSSFAIVRRLRRALARLAPPEVAERWREQARAWRDDVETAISEGREAMRARELELRAGMEPSREAAGAVAPVTPLAARAAERRGRRATGQ